MELANQRVGQSYRSQMLWVWDQSTQSTSSDPWIPQLSGKKSDNVPIQTVDFQVRLEESRVELQSELTGNPTVLYSSKKLHVLEVDYGMDQAQATFACGDGFGSHDEC